MAAEATTKMECENLNALDEELQLVQQKLSQHQQNMSRASDTCARSSPELSHTLEPEPAGACSPRTHAWPDLGELQLFLNTEGRITEQAIGGSGVETPESSGAGGGEMTVRFCPARNSIPLGIKLVHADDGMPLVAGIVHGSEASKLVPQIRVGMVLKAVRSNDVDLQTCDDVEFKDVMKIILTIRASKQELILVFKKSEKSTRLHQNGWMCKKGAKRHNWTRRWFQLNDTTLAYYKDPTDVTREIEPRGQIELNECKTGSVKASEASSAQRFELQVELNGRSSRIYRFRCDSKISFQSWLDVLSAAVDAPKSKSMYLSNKKQNRTHIDISEG